MSALGLLGSLVTETGARWGQVAAPWQVADAEAVLDGKGPRLHYWTRPRGGSKTSDAAAVALGILVEQALARARMYAFAADRDQSALLVDALGGYVERTGLASAVRVESYRITNVTNGATLEIMASDDSSAWGLRPFAVLVDEFAAWKQTEGPRRLWRAIFSALPKVEGSRLLVATSAGDPSHDAYKLLLRARASDAWRASEAPGPVPWISAADLAVQRAELPEWEYERLHHNVWASPPDRLVMADDLRACVSGGDWPREPAQGVRYVISVDVGLVHDRTAVAVLHQEVRERESGKRTVLDRLDVFQGTRDEPVRLGDVEATIVEAHRAFNKAAVVCDPYQCAQIIERLHDRQISARPFTFSSQSVSRLALRLHRLIRDHALELPDDGDLLDELGRVRLKETSPGSYRIDHDRDAHDDRAVAIALGAEWLAEHAKRTGFAYTGTEWAIVGRTDPHFHLT